MFNCYGFSPIFPMTSCNTLELTVDFVDKMFIYLFDCRLQLPSSGYRLTFAILLITYGLNIYLFLPCSYASTTSLYFFHIVSSRNKIITAVLIRNLLNKTSWGLRRGTISLQSFWSPWKRFVLTVCSMGYFKTGLAYT